MGQTLNFRSGKNTDLKLDAEHIRQALDAQGFLCFRGLAAMARVLAPLRLGILLIETPLEAQGRRSLEMLLLRDAIQTQAEVEEWLDRHVDIPAILACDGALRLAVEGLMHDALATRFVVCFCTLHALAVFGCQQPPAAIDLVQLFRQELKELVCVLLLVAGKFLVSLPLREPETGEDIRCGVASSDLLAVEVLKHVVHGAAHAVLDRAVCVLVPVTQVEVPEQGVVHKALEDYVHVAGSPHVVDASEAARTAWGFCCIRRDEPWILLGRFCKEFIMFPLPS